MRVTSVMTGQHNTDPVQPRQINHSHEDGNLASPFMTEWTQDKNTPADNLSDRRRNQCKNASRQRNRRSAASLTAAD